jgi:hypothetical protein
LALSRDIDLHFLRRVPPLLSTRMVAAATPAAAAMPRPRCPHRAGLAVFVARHAAFAHGDPDWLVIVLAVAAFVAAWLCRIGVVSIVATCAAVGLAASLG